MHRLSPVSADFSTDDSILWETFDYVNASSNGYAERELPIIGIITFIPVV